MGARIGWLWTAHNREGYASGGRSVGRAKLLLSHGFGGSLTLPVGNADGPQFFATMLSVIETCRQQRRNILAFGIRSRRSPSAAPPRPLISPQGVNAYRRERLTAAARSTD